MTDWISILDKDYERLEAVQRRRLKQVFVTIALIASFSSLGLGLIRQYGLTWDDLLHIAPWWVAVNLLSMGIQALYNIYLRIYLPGIGEKIRNQQKRPMLSPETIIRALTFLLMGIASAASIVVVDSEIETFLFVCIALIMIISSLRILFERDKTRTDLKESKIDKVPTRIRSIIDNIFAGEQQFTTFLVTAFFVYSIIGLILMFLLWDGDTWQIAIQMSIIFSGLIVALRTNFNQYGRIVAADKSIFAILELRVDILTTKTLTDAEISARYRQIFM